MIPLATSLMYWFSGKKLVFRCDIKKGILAGTK
jgi:hypothetical protein